MSGEGLNYQIAHLEKKIKIIYQFDKKSVLFTLIEKNIIISPPSMSIITQFISQLPKKVGKKKS